MTGKSPDMKIEMLEQLLQIDRELFLYLNQMGTESWDYFWLAVTNKYTSIPIYLLFLLLSFRFFGPKKTAVIILAVVLLITCTDQLANFFKYGVKRLRPCHDPAISELMRLVKSYCGGQYAFFSAHAANSFALAFFFTSLFRPKIRATAYIILLWAMLVAYSRIYIGVHYPLDVIFGALVGILFGWLFFKLYIFTLHKFSL